jgi:hypothetical protein
MVARHSPSSTSHTLLDHLPENSLKIQDEITAPPPSSHLIESAIMTEPEQKKRKPSNYRIFYHHLHKLLKKESGPVPVKIEADFWHSLTPPQKKVSYPSILFL